MNIKSLKVFCDVVRQRSFSRAANENGMSQSGASQVVHQLERHLGTKLIDRSKRPIALTPEGKAYHSGCWKLVRNYLALEESIRELHQDVAGRVTVASIYSVGLSHINRLVQQFLLRHPKADVRVEYQHPDQVYRLVERDQVDVGLVSYAKSTRTIEAMPWRNETMVLVCSPENRFARRESVALGELDGTKMVGFDQHLKIRREIDRALARNNAAADVVMDFDNIETIKRAIEIDAGVGLLPEPTVAREVAAETLIALPVEGPGLVRPISVIQRRARDLGKTALRFVQLLQESVARAESGDRTRNK